MRHLCHDQVLRVRPGLQVLYEVFTLQIPESLSSVDSRNVTKDNVYKSVQSVMVKIDLLTSARVMTLLQVSLSLSLSFSLSLSLRSSVSRQGPVPEGIWHLNAETISLRGKDCSGMDYKIGDVTKSALMINRGA